MSVGNKKLKSHPICTSRQGRSPEVFSAVGCCIENFSAADYHSMMQIWSAK